MMFGVSKGLVWCAHLVTAFLKLYAFVVSKQLIISCAYLFMCACRGFLRVFQDDLPESAKLKPELIDKYAADVVGAAGQFAPGGPPIDGPVNPAQPDNPTPKHVDRVCTKVFRLTCMVLLILLMWIFYTLCEVVSPHHILYTCYNSLWLACSSLASFLCDSLVRPVAVELQEWSSYIFNHAVAPVVVFLDDLSSSLWANVGNTIFHGWNMICSAVLGSLSAVSDICLTLVDMFYQRW
eukprot:CAMPEP_0175151078 /NCGR_PEP_ID=MMETSP0087-20121206/18271_1 /TAXON_ID=136419 /ORGANISM="Unknown Unknown, Strain D1" /LENGTH=236 /DNA_ID=CAMNT_0016437185 /DNA_START=16 /DNA_END=723 /DNA_ORIENTATION=+